MPADLTITILRVLSAVLAVLAIACFAAAGILLLKHPASALKAVIRAEKAAREEQKRPKRRIVTTVVPDEVQMRIASFWDAAPAVSEAWVMSNRKEIPK